MFKFLLITMVMGEVILMRAVIQGTNKFDTSPIKQSREKTELTIVNQDQTLTIWVLDQDGRSSKVTTVKSREE